MCNVFVTDYEFVKVNDHKSNLLMKCTNLEKLRLVMGDPFVEEWDKKMVVKILSTRLNLLNKQTLTTFLKKYLFNLFSLFWF